MNINLEQQPRPNGIPTISEDIRLQLFEELGLDDIKPEQQSNPPELPTTPEALFSSFAQELSKQRQRKERGHLNTNTQTLVETVFEDISQINPRFLPPLLATLKSNYEISRGYVDSTKVNCFCAGMAIVLRAFDLAANHNLLLNFERLGDADIQDFNREVSQQNAKRSEIILERILNSPRLPDRQVNLTKVVKSTQKQASAYIQRETEVGAVTTYNFLRQHWEILSK